MGGLFPPAWDGLINRLDQGLAFTKLDILDGFDEIKVCVGYRLDGREIDYLPASEHAQARSRPSRIMRSAAH